MLVGREARVSPEIANDDFDRVEGAILDRLYARIGRVQRVALITIVGFAALAERRVLAVAVRMRNRQPEGNGARRP